MNDVIPPWLREYLEDRKQELMDSLHKEESVIRLDEIDRIFAQEEH